MKNHKIEESLEGINLRAEMDDGSWWEIPAKFIALKAADSLLTDTTSMETYSNTVNDFLRNDEKIITWAEENMSWADVSAVARLIRAPKTAKYTKNWRTGMKMIMKND